MPSVGEQLRAAREKNGLSVSQIADRTKLRTDHVRALEEGNYDVFAAPVYVRGFVRSYAGLLHLNVAGVIADLEGELGHFQHLQDSTNLSKPPPGFVDLLMLQLSKVKWGITCVVVGAALILYIGVVGYRTWRVHRTVDPLANLGPGLYAPTDTNAGELLAVPVPGTR